MKVQHTYCCGEWCKDRDSEVRVYPLGGGGNLILCLPCWAHENKYRYRRGKETGAPENFPQVNWFESEKYEP